MAQRDMIDASPPVAEHAGNDSRGRYANTPAQIPTVGWLDVLKRLFKDIGRDNVSLMAAGIAFYALLSIAPAFTALVSVYGLVFDPASVEAQISALSAVVPKEALGIISVQLQAIVQNNTSHLGYGLVISLAIAMWSANSGTSALMTALNVAYGEEEKRGIIGYYGRSLLITLALVVMGILTLTLVAVMPAVLAFFPYADFTSGRVSWLRWPVLLILSTLGLAAIYRYGPSRNPARWHWVSWGAVAATLLWMAGSVGFSIYVGRFATYDHTYGSLGAVVVLLMWLWLTSFAVLLGAELDAELELQTTCDTTDHPRKPMGKRGAFVADRVASSD
jgi:membrane protein